MASIALSFDKKTKKTRKLPETKKAKVINALRKAKTDLPSSKSYSQFVNKLIAASDLEYMQGRKDNFDE